MVSMDKIFISVNNYKNKQDSIQESCLHRICAERTRKRTDKEIGKMIKGC